MGVFAGFLKPKESLAKIKSRYKQVRIFYALPAKFKERQVAPKFLFAYAKITTCREINK